MLSRGWLPVIAATFLLGGCASVPEYEVVGIPERQADVYPGSMIRSDVAVAANALGERRAGRAFGAPLRELEIMPVNIVISNHSTRRVEVTPSDVLLQRGNRVVDPLPVELVARAIEDWHRRVDDALAAEIRAYLDDVSFVERIITPGESYQGVLFFEVAKPKRGSLDRFRILSVFGLSPYRMSVRATQLDPRERLAFGPFELAP